MDLDSTIVGAVIAAVAVLVSKLGDAAFALVKRRARRKRDRGRKIAAMLTQVMEMRSIALAHAGARHAARVLVRERGGTEVDIERMLAHALPAMALPDPCPGYAAALDDLQADLPVLAWRLRKFLLVARPLSTLSAPHGALADAALRPVIFADVVDVLAEAALELAGYLEPAVLNDVRRHLAETRIETMTSDPEFGRALEEGLVRATALLPPSETRPRSASPTSDVSQLRADAGGAPEC